MDMTTQDYLKKALIDTQERVRDFMNYSDQIKETQLKDYFKEFAEMEGHQAQKLKGFIDEMQMQMGYRQVCKNFLQTIFLR